MINLRFQMKKVATIVACLAVTMMLAACDKKNFDDDDNGSGTGKGRTLTAEEKKLVGQYSYGSSSGGYWAYFNSGYDYWKQGWGSLAEGLWFKPDGTFNGVVFASGSGFIKGGSLSKTTGKWSVPRKGIIRFADLVENTEYADGSKNVWRQSEKPGWDPERKYEFKQQDDGTQGIMYGDKDELIYWFYRKTE